MELLAAINREKWLQLIYEGQRNAPTWADLNYFIAPRRADYKSLQCHAKHSSTEWFISSILRDEEMFARTYMCASEKGWKMDLRSHPTANHSPEWTNWFSTGIETTPQFQEIKQNQAIIVWMTKNKDFNKVRRKQSYNKHHIRLSNHPNFVGIIPILLENPESQPRCDIFIKFL